MFDRQILVLIFTIFLTTGLSACSFVSRTEVNEPSVSQGEIENIKPKKPNGEPSDQIHALYPLHCPRPEPSFVVRRFFVYPQFKCVVRPS